MKAYTNISGTKSPFSPQQGMANLQAAPPRFHPNQAVQQNFADNFTAAAHKGAMDLGRQNTLAGADYRQQATQAQNNAVLAGLSTLGQQQQNQFARDQAMQKMAYGWMGDMMGGGLLGGLL